jgi:uncharacterized protein (TIGR03437 family)
MGIPSRKGCVHPLLLLLVTSSFLSSSLWVQGKAASQPARSQAQYTQIYSDDIETISPTLSPAFSLGSAGSLTSNRAEVVSGNESIKGSYSGSGSSTPFLVTNPSVLRLAPNHSYSISFQYKILAAPNKPFYFQFFSQTAAGQNKFLTGVETEGAPGTTGTATLTSTLGNYTDYQGLWIIEGTGSISIDSIQITDAANGNVIAAENAEGTRPTLKSGIQLQGATVVTDPSLVISGKGSVLLNNQGGFITNPAVVPIGANTVYTIKFDYRIVSPGTADTLFFIWFQPAGTTDQQLQVGIPAMLKNSEVKGTFSTGAQTAGASAYVLNLGVAAGVSLIIDNISVYRQDVTMQNAPSNTWSRLLTAPFPRLGNYILAGTAGIAQFAYDEGKPFTYSVAQIENRLAFADVIAGLSLRNQTLDPDSIHRIRALNPNVVIVPQRMLEGQEITSAPFGSDIDLDYQLLKSTPNEWKATDTAGGIIYVQNYPDLLFMNLSDFVPAVNGQTWRTELPNFVSTEIFPSGLWDGVWFHFLEDVLNPDFPHNNDPALFNYDWNRNGLRDETPASTSEMIRHGKATILQQLNSNTNGQQLIFGNAGGAPQFALPPLINGYTFECFNSSWDPPGTPITSSSPASWRVEFDSYLRMQAILRLPQLNIMEACGVSDADFNTENFSNAYVAPTSQDLQKHRLSMGTALLGNGFYEYDLKDALSAPYWFDEYSVDSSGNAIEDRTKKGYLGLPLSDAVELTNQGTLVFQERFDSGSLPNSFIGSSSNAVSITQAPGEVISGAGSLVLSNPDHTRQGTVSVGTNPSIVPLSAGTYLLTFDWRVLETVDCPESGFRVYVSGLDHALVPGTVAGDSGTLRFPFTVPTAGNWSINWLITNGGGKVAIDNVHIYQGGVGLWRRDFENGFVLVNPFAQPHTFSAADLAGALSRTGIHRIKGTQAPDVNNGQAVTGDLTVGPFDAIVLLADRIAVAAPTISTVSTADGAPNIAQNGWIAIKGSNFTPPGVGSGGMTWDNAFSFQSGIMPSELGGVRVTVNGKPAFIYFASANQINVLSPLDNSTGPVEIVVTSGGISSAPFITNLQTVSPSFPLVGSSYVVATHTDYSLVGPTSLSAPGYPFTPAHKGETIVLYAFGLGLPTTTLVNGSSIQSGPLPMLPQVKIGGATAMVTFAGVISPGLYQLNVTIPQGAQSGDNSLILTYNSQTSPADDLISVQ